MVKQKIYYIYSSYKAHIQKAFFIDNLAAAQNINLISKLKSENIYRTGELSLSKSSIASTFMIPYSRILEFGCTTFPSWFSDASYILEIKSNWMQPPTCCVLWGSLSCSKGERDKETNHIWADMLSWRNQWAKVADSDGKWKRVYSTPIIGTFDLSTFEQSMQIWMESFLQLLTFFLKKKKSDGHFIPIHLRTNQFPNWFP